MTRLVRRGGAILLLWATAGCGVLPGVGEPGPLGYDASAYDRGLDHLARGSFAAADSALRSVVDRCASEEEARTSLLLLASLHQDARNPDPRPDSAALMAARYLAMDGTPESGRRLAEGIYVQALDRGGNPGLRADGSWPAGGGCTVRPGSDRDPLILPVLELSPYAVGLAAARARLDSLRSVERALRARSQELEAELARIRRLLQQPDTAGSGARRHR